MIPWAAVQHLVLQLHEGRVHKRPCRAVNAHRMYIRAGSGCCVTVLKQQNQLLSLFGHNYLSFKEQAMLTLQNGQNGMQNGQLAPCTREITCTTLIL